MLNKIKGKALESRIALGAAAMAAFSTPAICCAAGLDNFAGGLGGQILTAVKWLAVIGVLALSALCVIKKETSKLIATLIIGGLIIAIVFSVNANGNNVSGGFLKTVGDWLKGLF